MDDHEKEMWFKALDEWKASRSDVEALYKRMDERRADGAIYVLTPEDIKLLQRNINAWDELLRLARQP